MVWLVSPRERAIPVIEPSSRIASPSGKEGLTDQESAEPPITRGCPMEHSCHRVHDSISER